MKLTLNLLLSIILLAAVSCRTDELPTPNVTEDPFFNLNVGNKWVYKTYRNPDFTNPQSSSTFTGRIDSISIVGKENIQGFTVAKERTKTHFPNSNLNGNVSYRYLRVNTKGHLVSYPASGNIDISETGGHVLHPGMDINYIYNNPIFDLGPGSPIIGNVLYQLQNESNIIVEGTSYTVFPYKGVFTPISTTTGLLPKTQDISYKKGLGLVKEICHAVYGNDYLETRLVSSKIIY